MRFAFSEEQEEIRRQVRRAIADGGGVLAARRAMLEDAATDLELWRRLTRDLGLAGLAIPEAHGGAGLGWVEIVAVIEELGASLACVPFLSSACLATAAILEAGTPAQHDALLPPMARGEATATLAWLEAGGDASPAAIETAARVAQGDHVILSGTKRHVVDGHTADLLLVTARTPDGAVALYAVPAAAAGVERRRLPTMDATRAQAEIVLSDVHVPASSRLGGGGWPPIGRALAKARIALAAEQVGGAQACLDLGVGYAKVREQFGRPIGSFQAIQHTLADMFVLVETARSSAYHAAWDGEHEPDLEITAAATAAYCAAAFYRCAADTIQVHGGIGFTWEHDAHLYFKRARAGRTLLGSMTDHRDTVARSLGLGPLGTQESR
ncbi:MAG: acyl-CoA dehydrogenase [Myxococcales bacterium]|nr:acyl-CoA dehydrogenase [Myxococcales bacterium]